MGIVASTEAYEAFLRSELGNEVVEEGLAEKHEAMAGEVAFPFLRATYWRWAERIVGLVDDLAAAPSVLAVGDIHLENYGTWRDADGRLVWGVNDYDEAAEMPYVLDLLRLATSALLACPQSAEPDAVRISGAILEGYGKGLREPRPLILDRKLEWLRKLVIVPEDERDAFWDKLEKKRRRFLAKPEAERPQLWSRYREALQAALPLGSGEPEIWYRSAGLGSLGRPRWVAQAQWCGDWVVREAKGIVPSAWTRMDGKRGRTVRCMEIATGRHRAPDPWYRVMDGIAVRRLSPNNRKIGADKAFDPEDESGAEGKLGRDVLLSPKMLEAMGRELAAIHLGTGDVGGAVERDLATRAGSWLEVMARRAAEDVRAEHATFRNDWLRRNSPR
jgi:hypothetical protein